MSSFKFNKFNSALTEELMKPQPPSVAEVMSAAKKKIVHSDLLAQELSGVENEPGYPPIPATPKVEPYEGTVKHPLEETFSMAQIKQWTSIKIVDVHGAQKMKDVAKNLGLRDQSEVERELTAKLLKDHNGLREILKSCADDHIWNALKADHVSYIAQRAGFTKKLPTAGQGPVGELRHKQFDGIFRWLTSRTGSDIFQPVWLYGGPGGGKSTLAEQMAPVLHKFAVEDADERGLDITIPEDFLYPMTCSDTTTKSDLIGFKSAAHGAYAEGLARRPFEHGGLLFMDEIDNSNSSFLVSANALKSQKFFRFPDGTLVKRHPYFFVLAGANTLGTGSTNGFQRKAQDAAARDRYAKVHFEYDEGLELKLAGNDRWVTYVQKVRKYVNQLAKCAVHITPRASYGGAAALRNGVPPSEVAYAFIFVEFTKDVQVAIKTACGEFKG